CLGRLCQSPIANKLLCDLYPPALPIPPRVQQLNGRVSAHRGVGRLVLHAAQRREDERFHSGEFCDGPLLIPAAEELVLIKEQPLTATVRPERAAFLFEKPQQYPTADAPARFGPPMLAHETSPRSSIAMPSGGSIGTTSLLQGLVAGCR